MPKSEKNTEELIEQVAAKSGKSKKEIRELMEERKEATHGLLSDYGALYAVAKKFGISFQEEKAEELTKLSEISPQKPCSVVGRVKRVLPVKEFKRKDSSSGKMASVFLVDDSGERRLILWDNSASLAKKLSKGDILLVRNAYGKEGLQGEVELHAGSLTHLTINPKNFNDLPEIEEKLWKIKDLKDKKGEVNLICRVSTYYPPTEFTRDDGSTGVRASFMAEDETGEIRVVLWGENAEKKLKRGDFVKIENGYIKEGLNQELELHLGSLGKIQKTEQKLSLPELPERKDQGKTLKIGEIKEDSFGFNTLARVIDIFPPRSYSKGNFASLIVGDLSGSIRVVLWDEKSQIVEKLKKGDAIKIQNAYSKPNLNQEPEIHLGKFGEITLDQESILPPLEEIESSLTQEKKIKDLSLNDKFVKIKGKVVEVENRKILYFTCPNCKTKIQDLGMGWYCDICEEEVEPQPNLVLSFTLEDETGSVRAVAFRDQAEKILDMDLEEIMNVIGETQNELEPLEKANESLLNTELSLIGRTRYSNFSDQLEFIVTKVI